MNRNHRMCHVASLLPLLIGAAHSMSEKDMEDAERRMHELLNGEASLSRYIVGAVALVLLFCFVCGSLIWCFNVMFGCCSATRSCFSCLFGCCWRRKKQKLDTVCLGPHAPVLASASASASFDSADRAACPRTTVSLRNASGVRVPVPYCDLHVVELQRRLFEAGAPFEKRGKARHSINFFHGDAYDPDYDPSTEINNAIAKANRRVRRPGFIYMFRSKEDLSLVKYGGDKVPYFFKIGKTEQPTALERVQQWEDAQFGNVEGVDYWRVASATNAELLIHALSAKARVDRFDRIDQAFEIEWFFDTRENLTRTIRAVVEADRNGTYTGLRKDQ